MKTRYGSVATGGLSTDHGGVRAVAESFGYTPEELASIPAEANMALSCGNPTAMAGLKPGETVVDLGSGGGLGVFLAALGGFENLNSDCEARGHRALPGANDFCYAEYEIAIAAYTMGPPVQSLFLSLGYVPVTDPAIRCIGAQGSASCGAPTVQPLEACLPPRPDDRGPPPILD